MYIELNQTLPSVEFHFCRSPHTRTEPHTWRDITYTARVGPNQFLQTVYR